MKKILMLSIILFSFSVYAQNRSKTFSISYGAGNGDITDYSTKKVGRMSNEKGRSLQVFGLNYFDEIGKNLFIETGLSLLKHDYTLTSWRMEQSGFVYSSSDQTFKLLTIPLKLRFEFGKYFFLNGGLMADIELDKTQKNMSEISGIGLGLGLGVQYYYQNKIGIFVNPQVNAHGLLGLRSTRGILERNITFGVAYRIN